MGKHALITSAALLLAAALTAAVNEEKPATKASDSPLVAAAKKSSRAGKKRAVITNASLKHSTGHITTTKAQHPITVPQPQKTTDQWLTENKARERDRDAVRARVEKKTAEEKQKNMSQAAAAAEDEGPFGVDPAQTEHQLEQGTSTAPPTSTSRPPSRHDDSKHP
ncbi:MAG: hypothetical protein NVSMB68_15630 [Thermoanaerobaculia bacterium]